MDQNTLKTVAPMTMLEKTIAYSLSIHSTGTSRRVDADLIQTDADKDKIGVSKRIMQCEELRKIGWLDSSLRSFIKSRCVPYPLKAGIYLVPTTLIEEVDAQVERVKALRSKLVEDFASKVEDLKKSDETALGSLYNAKDYPTRERILADNYVETRYIALDLPANLNNASKEVYERERARIVGELERAGQAIQQVQRAQLAEMVNALIDKLQPTADGKKKQIRQGGALDKIKEFLDRYSKLNVADDGELAAIAEKAQAVLSGVDVDAIRSNEVLARKVEDGMREVSATLAPLIQDAPARRFRLA